MAPAFQLAFPLPVQVLPGDEREAQTIGYKDKLNLGEEHKNQKF